MTGNYGYDAIGELTKDSTNGISNVSWTVYGKIQQITKSDGGTLVFTYDPSGNRISKTYTPAGGSAITTWYVRDAQGNILSIYTSGDVTVNGGDLSLTESDIYGSSRLGMLRTTIDVYNPTPVTPVILPLLGQGYGVIFARGDKLFELTNHLGNVLATISDKKFGVSLDGSTVDHYVPQVVSANDYYPFGSQMPGRDTTLGGKYYRYGFNGKENDNEVKGVGDQIDYIKRIYDPRVGRFLSTDPMTRSYPQLTPYQFASNTPIQAIDLDGEEAGFVINWLADNAKASGKPVLSGFIRSFGGADPWYNATQLGKKILHGDIKGAAAQVAGYSIPGMAYNLVRTGVNAIKGDKEALGNIAGIAVQVAIAHANAPAGAAEGTSAADAGPQGAADAQASATHGGQATTNSSPASPPPVTASAGKTIGLGLYDELSNHRGTGAITYENGGWQQAGLTKVDWGRATMDDYSFKESFWDAAKNADAIRFDVTNFDPFRAKPQMTNYEFSYIVGDQGLLNKTTFIRNGKPVEWNGKTFEEKK